MQKPGRTSPYPPRHHCHCLPSARNITGSFMRVYLTFLYHHCMSILLQSGCKAIPCRCRSPRASYLFQYPLSPRLPVCFRCIGIGKQLPVGLQKSTLFRFPLFGTLPIFTLNRDIISEFCTDNPPYTSYHPHMPIPSPRLRIKSP